MAKFHYLTSSLGGAAANTLNGLDVFPENYNEAWAKMLKDYDNNKALIRTHLKTFVCLPNGKFDTASELRTLRNTVTATLLNLAELGCQVNTWDPIVVFIVTK